MVPSTTLRPHPTSAGAARRFVADVLLNRGFTDPCIQRAMEATDELVADAILRTDSDIELVVAVAHPRVRVEVSAASSPDQARAGDGRALRLVKRLSDALGMDRAGTSGRSMWFEMRS